MTPVPTLLLDIVEAMLKYSVQLFMGTAAPALPSGAQSTKPIMTRNYCETM
jgi:hypothetical protein